MKRLLPCDFASINPFLRKPAFPSGLQMHRHYLVEKTLHQVGTGSFLHFPPLSCHCLA
jgi:hypothetical protein